MLAFRNARDAANDEKVVEGCILNLIKSSAHTSPRLSVQGSTVCSSVCGSNCPVRSRRSRKWSHSAPTCPLSSKGVRSAQSRAATAIGSKRELTMKEGSDKLNSSVRLCAVATASSPSSLFSAARMIDGTCICSMSKISIQATAPAHETGLACGREQWLVMCGMTSHGWYRD